MPDGAEAGAVAAYSNVVARVPANNPTGTKLGAASSATNPNLSPGVIRGGRSYQTTKCNGEWRFYICDKKNDAIAKQVPHLRCLSLRFLGLLSNVAHVASHGKNNVGGEEKKHPKQCNSCGNAQRDRKSDVKNGRTDYEFQHLRRLSLSFLGHGTRYELTDSPVSEAQIIATPLAPLS